MDASGLELEIRSTVKISFAARARRLVVRTIERRDVQAIGCVVQFQF